MLQRWLKKVNPFTILLLIGIPLSGLSLAQIYESFRSVHGEAASRATAAFGLIGLFSLIVIPILFILRRNYAVKQAAWAGACWLHWEYTPEDQAAYKGHLPRGSQEAYIGPRGVYYPGARFPVRAIGGSLSDVGIEIGPVNVLRLTYTTMKLRRVRNPYSRRYYHLLPTSSYKYVDVPIPRGHESEAYQLGREWDTRSTPGRDYYLPTERVVAVASLMLIGFCMCSAFTGAGMSVSNISLPPTATPTALPARLKPQIEELKRIRAKLDSRLSDWQLQPSREQTQVDPPDVGFAPDSGVESVTYGYCSVGNRDMYFYALVVEPVPTTARDVDIYIYTAFSEACSFHNATVLTPWTELEPDWYYLRLRLNTDSDHAL